MNTIKDANLVNQISGNGNPTSIEAAANAMGDISGTIISNQ